MTAVPYVWCSVIAATVTGCATQADDQPDGDFPVDVGVAAPVYVDAIAAGRTFLDSLTNAVPAPGMSVAVGAGGELVWSEARGYADVATRRPMLTTTPIRIHSVSKPVTAFALAQLVERGQLDLDAPIQRYVPTFPVKRGPMTLRQLGGHLAGVRHYREDSEVLNRTRYQTVLESVDQFATEPLLHAPGERYSYSSYGFNLIGAAIESACGAAFAQCLDRLVVTPLSMSDTYLDGLNDRELDEPEYYELTADGPTVAPQMDLSNRWPGGGIVSTASDLVVFGLTMLRDEYSSRSTRELLLTPQVTAAGDTIPTALDGA